MSTLTVGTISEKVTDAGVAVDGVTLKDGGATFTSDVTIGDASASDKKILFDGNAQDFHIGLDDSSDSLTIGLGSALGTTSHMVIDANGAVTKPLQPAFHAKAPGTQSNLSINTGHDVTFNSERFDQNGDYDGTNLFTAPVTGKYQLNVNLYLQNIDKDASYIQVGVITSNKSYYLALATVGFDADPLYFPFTTSVLADMDANDVAKVEVYQSGGSAVLDLDGHSNFSGYLVC